MGGARLVYNCKALAEPVAKRGHGAFCVWREPRAGKETEVSNHRCILLVAYGGPHQQENLVIPSPLRYLPWQGLLRNRAFSCPSAWRIRPTSTPTSSSFSKAKSLQPPARRPAGAGSPLPSRRSTPIQGRWRWSPGAKLLFLLLFWWGLA